MKNDVQKDMVTDTDTLGDLSTVAADEIETLLNDALICLDDAIEEPEEEARKSIFVAMALVNGALDLIDENHKASSKLLKDILSEAKELQGILNQTIKISEG